MTLSSILSDVGPLNDDSSMPNQMQTVSPGKRFGRPPKYTKEERLVRDRELQKLRRLKLQEEINQIKHERGCSVCGTSKGSLEFHHPNGANGKHNRLSNIHSRRKKFAELEKVIVLCASCHKTHHATTRERDALGRFVHCS